MTHRERTAARMLKKINNLTDALYNLDRYIEECDSYPEWVRLSRRHLDTELTQLKTNYYMLAK